MNWVIGTDDSCDVRIKDDPYVSNRHCRITLADDGSLWVEDLGSTNGTRVRYDAATSQYLGTKVSASPMRVLPGVVITVGRTDIPWSRTR